MIDLKTSTRRRFGAVTLVALAASLAACGGASPARSPEMKSEPEATTIEEAQARIAAAKAELAGDTRAGSAPAKAGTYATPPGADAPRPAEASPPPPPPTSQSREPSMSESSVGSGGSGSSKTSDDRCGSPCRALASMRRAVTALCRMTGSDDNRCVDAKRTLTESEGRVSPCSC